MKINRRVIFYIFWCLAGILLIGLGIAGTVDSFWSGMGSAMIVMSAFRLVRIYRYRKDEIFREAVDTAVSDERNHFLRGKAWAWAGYLFILIAGVSVIVLKIAGQELLSFAASWAVCLMLVLYWGSWLILRKKY